MKIAFNMAHIETIFNVTGVGAHQLNIIEGIMGLKLEDFYIFFVNDVVNKQLKKIYPTINTYNYGEQYQIPIHIKKFYLYFNNLYLDQVIFKKTVKKMNVDIIFQPFNCNSIRTNFKQPVVTLVLDMYHRFYKEWLSFWNYNITLQKHNRIFKNSSVIITSSIVNKKHIKQFYKKVKDKNIKVIPVPISIDVTMVEEYKIDKPYIVCVNSLRYHKNIHTLIKAFNHIKDEIDYDLVLIGSYDVDEVDNYKNRNSRIHFTGHISDAKRNYLYQHTSLFISPTMFEGFGMTPLEAMLFKKKVLVSDIEVMRESTFNSAIYFDDIENDIKLGSAIKKALEVNLDEVLQANKEKVEQIYSPKTVAKKIHQVFEELYQEGTL